MKDVISTLGVSRAVVTKNRHCRMANPIFGSRYQRKKKRRAEKGITFARAPSALCFPRELNEFTREFAPRSAGFNLHCRERDRQTNHFSSRSFHIFHRPTILAAGAHGLAVIYK